MRRLLVLVIAALVWSANAQTLTIAISEGMPGFDPTQTTRTVANDVYPNIFDGLLALDREGQIVPSLALSWDVVNEKDWHLTLRQGVRWHDGETFDAEDVKFTLERLATNQELIRHVLMAELQSVEIVNPYEVVLHMANPDPLLPVNLTMPATSMLPAHYFEAVGLDKATQAPIGTGPYKFVEYRPDDRLVLAVNEDYWGGKAAFSELVFRVITESTTSVSELVTGGVAVSNIGPNDLERVESSGVAHVTTQVTNRVVHWTLNVSDGQATADKRVREAIDLAIDNQVFIDVLENGYGTPTRVRTGPGDNFMPTKYYGTYNYDPARAVELLAEAGYGPGELTITIMGASSVSDRAELTAAMLEAVGIVPDIQLFESSVWSSKYWTPGEFTNMAGVGSSNSAMDYGSTLSDLQCPEGAHSQRSHWCNEEFSDLVRAANREMDTAKRAELLDAATEILVEELPQIYLYNSVGFIGVSDDLDWSPRPDGSLLMFDARPAN
ncbi:MAG: hypothetical protein KF875_05385 [Trueperaceae bacterium]|nr:hypothetical protein [Trueperaceae bacterium]MCC6311638.1 ABC transporter substrate-binding protein [Trueperaceae bacterium]MCO5174481.1 ABC transporter substrate-binding protein [Trueperaceae bacterium]MCW5818293.1 hypothetical protein [Trueperaceae bacterium]